MGSAALAEIWISIQNVSVDQDLNPYKRLLSRFYEQLFLLNALDRPGQPHNPSFELDARRAKAVDFFKTFVIYATSKKEQRMHCSRPEELGYVLTIVSLTTGRLQIANLRTALPSKNPPPLAPTLKGDTLAHPRLAHNHDYVNRRSYSCALSLLLNASEGKKKMSSQRVKDCLSRLKGQT